MSFANTTSEGIENYIRGISTGDIQLAYDSASEIALQRFLDANKYYERLPGEERITKFPERPAINTFPFAQHFIEGDKPVLDEFFIRNGFLNMPAFIEVKIDYSGKTEERLFTALSYACFKGDSGRIEFLLNRGANPNPVELYPEEQPLVYALSGRGLYSRTIKLLIDKGADTTIVLPGNRNLINVYSETDNGNDSVVKVLVEAGIDINNQDDNGTTILYEACSNWQFESGYDIRELLQLGANPKLKTAHGRTPLIPMCHQIQYWLENGYEQANENDGDAYEYVQEEMRGIKNDIEDLIKYGADPKVIADDGTTCFTETYLTDVYEILYDEKQKDAYLSVLNAKMKHDGKTALTIHANDGYYYATEWLIRHGADPRVFLKDVPLICVLLQKYSSKLKTDKYDELKDDKGALDATIGQALKYPGILDMKDNNGNTVIMYCLHDLSLLQYITKALQTERKNFFNTANNEGDTPLMKAVADKALNSVIKFLVDNGANIMHKNKKGNTPLDFRNRTNQVDYLKTLVQKTVVRQQVQALPADNGANAVASSAPTQRRTGLNEYELAKANLENEQYTNEQLIGTYLSKNELVNLATMLGLKNIDHKTKEDITELIHYTRSRLLNDLRRANQLNRRVIRNYNEAKEVFLDTTYPSKEIIDDFLTKEQLKALGLMIGFSLANGLLKAKMIERLIEIRDMWLTSKLSGND
jgi:ankyrin repeat protein